MSWNDPNRNELRAPGNWYVIGDIIPDWEEGPDLIVVDLQRVGKKETVYILEVPWPVLRSLQIIVYNIKKPFKTIWYGIQGGE